MKNAMRQAEQNRLARPPATPSAKGLPLSGSGHLLAGASHDAAREEAAVSARTCSVQSPAAGLAAERNIDRGSDISACLTLLLADVFALCIKTKGFHWHGSGRRFSFLCDHASQLFAMSDQIAECVGNLNGTTICSIGQIARLQRLPDNDEPDVGSLEMLEELVRDNRVLAANIRQAAQLMSDVADEICASQLDIWLRQADERLVLLAGFMDGSI